jgi:hypothetical protein
MREDRINPSQQIERWYFVAVQQATQPFGPVFFCSTFLLGKEERSLRHAAADGELFSRPLQPSIKIRAVCFRAEHVPTMIK